MGQRPLERGMDATAYLQSTLKRCLSDHRQEGPESEEAGCRRQGDRRWQDGAFSAFHGVCKNRVRVERWLISLPSSAFNRSAALNFAHVATGQLDMYQEIGCWSWDVCAGVVIAREAGGKVRAGHRANAPLLNCPH